MKLERFKDEIIITLPANINVDELQNLIDYLEYQQQTSKSKAKQEDIDELSTQVNQSIWSKYKNMTNYDKNDRNQE